jgi:para-nitrobenzyl esterase
MAPNPVQPWEGVCDALEFGPSVPHAGHTGSVMSSASGSTRDGSEDRLTLNVWSPDLGAARLPVMVWIQGGTYLENHSANPHYDGATLARSGVVVVSMNYRVGADGFAPNITGALDNPGILDQIAALRWVQDNIATFGGVDAAWLRNNVFQAADTASKPGLAIKGGSMTHQKPLRAMITSGRWAA